MNLGAGLLGSDSKKPSKPRLRFNFLGKNERRKSTHTIHEDILNSLTRHARSHGETTEERTSQVAESVDSAQLEEQIRLPTNPAGSKGNIHAGRTAFLLFVAGFLAVWSYGYLTGAYDIPYLSTLQGHRNFKQELGLSPLIPSPQDSS